MGRKEIEELVCRHAEPIAASLNLELYDVEYLQEGGSWYLRVYIEKPEGVNIDDCEAVSEKLSEVLDRLDPIPQQYYLEVSSPGAERALKKDSDFVRYAGHLVEVTLYQPMEGEKKWRGLLAGKSDDEVRLNVGSKEGTRVVAFPIKQVAQVRLAIEF